MTVSIDSQNDSGYKYVYGLGLAYAVDSLGNPLTQHTDGLGSVRAETDSSGNVVQKNTGPTSSASWMDWTGRHRRIRVAVATQHLAHKQRDFRVAVAAEHHRAHGSP